MHDQSPVAFLRQKKRIFLLDSVGALTSASMLGLVLPALHTWVGMPLGILYLLAAWALVYATYSMSCYAWAREGRSWLRILIAANLLYCGVTLAMVLYYFERLMGWGIVYFGAESIVVLALVWLEKKVLQASSRMAP